MKKALAVWIFAAIGAAATSAGAHENFRIIGTLTKVTDREIDVKNKDSKTLTIAINDGTVVRRDREKERLPLSALKVGQSVVVNAWGDNESELEALDIRIVPPIGSKPR